MGTAERAPEDTSDEAKSAEHPEDFDLSISSPVSMKRAVDVELAEEDPKPDRRKRFRLSRTPDSEPDSEESRSWKEQLEAVAGHEPRNAAESVKEVAEKGDGAREQAPTPSTPPRQIMDRVEIEVDATYAARFGHGSGQVTTEVQRTATTTDQGKPKKMLRLKPNGKFSSPPQKPENMSPQKSKSNKRGRRKKEEKAQLIAVWRYPSTSDAVRLGERIARVLEGAERIVNRKQENPKVKVSPAKPTGPHKPTHPFFLAKAARMEHTQEHSKPANSPAERSPHQGRSPLRRRATATPIKPKVHFGLPTATAKSPPAPRFGATNSGFIKHPGARDAPWPDSSNRHVRGDPNEMLTPSFGTDRMSLGENGKKTRETVFVLPDENIISRCADQLGDPSSFGGHCLRKAKKLLMPDSDIQSRVSLVLNSPLDDAGTEMLNSILTKATKQHPALRKIYASIKDYLSPFDKFECEQQLWIHKYAPQKAEDVLQQGPEVTILRDWLKQCTVTSVDTGSRESHASLDVSNKKTLLKQLKKRKRKRTEELDDFIVSSDEESNELEELSELDDLNISSNSAPTRSVVRGGVTTLHPGQLSKVGNSILLSGPHGCGKTAAVYAVAKELGFEVFELNSSSRRSGKDVLDKIGDMTENHLVQQVAKALSENKVDDQRPVDVAPPRDEPGPKQKSMASFFKPMTHKKPSLTSKPSSQAANSKKSRPAQQQKQSLILLEEVDVLFEDDKQFWLTVLTLAKHSKRPIVMTCNDENLVPLDALTPHAILRFNPPPNDVAVDYLLLIAAREGHLFGRDAVNTLWEAFDHDLRASIMELNFWCQMGVGADNCLEWLYQRWPPGSDLNDKGQRLRVVSDGTYLAGLGFYNRDLVCCYQPNAVEEVMMEARKEWEVSDEDLEAARNLNQRKHSSLDVSARSFWADYLSAADLYCGIDRVFNATKQPLDASIPKLSEKSRLNYTVAYPVLEADPPPTFTNLDEHFACSALALATGPDAVGDSTTTSNSSTTFSVLERSLVDVILAAKAIQSQPQTLSRSSFSIFDTLAEPSSSQQPTSLAASSFDREFSVITTDLAPYVRSIAAYDLQLEAERLSLSNLLSGGGRAKRPRTTRAARSALEGGKRESTRRERWFDKGLNLQLVIETGGKEWSGMGGRADEKRMEGSVASTVGSVETSPSP